MNTINDVTWTPAAYTFKRISYGECILISSGLYLVQRFHCYELLHIAMNKKKKMCVLWLWEKEQLARLFNKPKPRKKDAACLTDTIGMSSLY